MVNDNLNEKIIDFDAIRISLASPEQILSWSHGEVTKPETINYRTQKPEKDGLFCERIFGPTKDWECYCGKYKKIRYKGIICDKCGVQVTRSLVRRERMGHIKLAAPVAHIWYLRSVPSRIGLYLGLSIRDLEKVVYFASFIVMSVDGKAKERILKDMKEEYESFVEEIGGELEKRKKGLEKEIDQEMKKNPTSDKKDITKKVQDSFKQWQKEMEEKKTEMQQAYEEAKAEISSINKYSILSEGRYFDLNKKYGTFFEAGIGAEAILNLIKELDVKKLADELAEEREKAIGQRRKKITKRLRFMKGFVKAGLDPAWMVMTHLAVIPPDIRPMVQLDGGRFATSDMNDLYRRVINRNNRLKKLQELRAPEVIQRNEKRMLQEAVDSLIGNDSQRGKNIIAVGKKKLKSLSEVLKGKQGRFRQNLLGKRVDYSGRSVIVVGPDLKLDECGVPKTMALELFKPFIISELISRGFTHSAKNAAKSIDTGAAEVWDILEDVTKKYYVLLNRAPTLHRLGIQAFKVILIEGKAIRIHPLVCAPFNADFDGDQMAIHLPLSTPAQEEAREMMVSSKNLLKPSDGSPAITPSQDIVLGCYYITTFENGALGDGKTFPNKEEALLAYQSGKVHIRAKIKVRLENLDIVETTIGRLMFNEKMPAGIGFINESMDKKALERVVAKSFKELGIETTAQFVDDIKNIGMSAATLSGITLSISDLVIPESKKGYIMDADKKTDELDQQYKGGLITANEKYLKNIELWTQTKENIEKDLMTGLDEKNPLRLMSSSKARGSKDQISQLVAIRGLLMGPSGNIIELPVKSNFKEGLTVLEYFISSHSARKGLTDTALRTSDSGYLTRRMVDVAQDIIVSEADCGAHEGIEFFKDESNDDIRNVLIRKLDGRTLVVDIVDKKGQVLFKTGEELNIDKVDEIIKHEDVRSVKVRSVLNCKSKWGICQICYGKDLARGRLVKLGEAVGIVAAQSIGEPGTQLTMRTFHSGGIAKRDITQGLPRVEELFEARTPKGKALIAELAGTVELLEDKAERLSIRIISDEPKKDIIKMKAGFKVLVKEGEKVEEGQALIEVSKNKQLKSHGKGTIKLDKQNDSLIVIYNKKEERIYPVEPDAEIMVEDGDKVGLGDQLTEGHIDLHQLLSIKGSLAVKQYVVREIQDIYDSQGQSINDKHIEVIIRQMFSKIRIIDPAESEFVEGETVSKLMVDEYNEVAKKDKKKEIIFEELLLGITKASLSTDSFLSAASFQETTSVLIDAATTGKIDYLRGLKENTILGKLIPAGTGFRIIQK
ncbi:MAG: DNA-directed RNA polymerase subunit beta' [Patescibacteria group bacterium]|nr:DNA-directed RNA polymerase subunit beta' [Patescibacteria group bacterium]